MPTASLPGPTEPQNRLQSIDAARGVALFGVLLVNMYNFGAYAPEWNQPVDRLASFLMHSVFETKSLRLFSLLFGLGFALLLDKALPRSGFLWFWFRRMAILFGIGMVHALLFDGDILMEYALLGLLLLAFRHVSQRFLLVLCVALLMAFPIGNFFHTYSDEERVAQSEDVMPLSELREGHPYLGSLVEVWLENSYVIPPRIGSGIHKPESSLTVLSMFLLGLFVARAGLLRDMENELPRIRKVLRWGLGVGVVCAFFEWVLKVNFGYSVYSISLAPKTLTLAGDLLFTFGSTALAMGFGAGVIVLANIPACRRLVVPFRNLGRMALTSYLGGSLMFTTLFYGYGFGQLFLLGPAETTLYAMVFFGVLLIFCSWWLSRFRYGPAEWLWRSLTYGHLQPMRQ